MSQPLDQPNPDSGTARLAVIIPAALLSFFYGNILEYALPLYFEARTEVARLAGGEFPLDVWAEVVKYKVTAWLVGPLAAGLFARRYGERVVWSAALLGKVPVPVILAMHPHPNVMAALAIWQGFTGALMWIAGASMFQMVVPGKKAFSNAWMMMSIGIGSVVGPFVGRGILYRDELKSLIGERDWSEFWSRFLNLHDMQFAPRLVDFESLFWLLTGTTLLCGLLIGLWGQRPGRYGREDAPSWSHTLSDLRTLARNPAFWALVTALCLFGGPVFQSSNQFLPYRAKELGLIGPGGADHGWIWLQMLKVVVWIPAGAAVGLLAGRRAPGIAAVAMLGGFSLAAIAIGASHAVWQIFCCVAAFEFVRQFMRWSHAAYISEHMPPDLRPTAIGFAITFSGVGSTIFAWIAPTVWDPKLADFQSSGPFWAAGVLGLAASVGLLLFDRFRPIREARSTDDGD